MKLRFVCHTVVVIIAVVVMAGSSSYGTPIVYTPTVSGREGTTEINCSVCRRFSCLK